MKKKKILKPFFAVLILLLLSAIMTAIIMSISFLGIQSKTEYRNSMKAKNAVQALRIIERDVNRNYNSMESNTQAAISMTVMALSSFMNGNYYNGPRIFDDGVVLQTRGSQVIYPSDYPDRFEMIIGEIKADSKEEPQHEPLTAEHLQQEISLLPAISLKKDNNNSSVVVLTSRKMAEDYWYIDLTPYDEYLEMLQEQREIFQTIEDLQKAFDGYLFLFERNTPDLKAYYTPSEFSEITKAEDMGITQETIDSNLDFLSFNEENYYSSFVTIRMFRVPLTAVILINAANDLNLLVSNIIMIMVLIIGTGITVILWLYWIQRYVSDKALTEDQREKYHPRHVRKAVRSIGVIGIILMFIIAASIDSLGNLSLESNKNNNMLDLMKNRMGISASMVSRYRNDIESWAVYDASKLAEILIKYPDFQNPDFLKYTNALIKSEYIILFDENGQEIISSNGYINLNMMTDLSESGDDFKKLLNGASQVILEPEKDMLTGKTTQLIGVSAYSGENEKYQALIIAIDPEITWKTAEKQDFNNFLDMITPSGNLSYIVEKESGLVIYSTRDEDCGKDFKSIGLYEKDIQDTELDTFQLTIDSDTMFYYGAYQQDNQNQYYYLTNANVLVNNTLPYASACSIGFLVIYCVITTFMLHSYRSKKYNETVQIAKTTFRNSIFDDSINSEWISQQNNAENQENLLEIWRELVPEKKTSIFIQIIFAVILINYAIALFQPNSKGTQSVIFFILQGTWRRGVNLLSFAGIVILILSFVVFVLFKNLLLNIITNALDPKAKTIFRLAFSLIQYAAIIVLLYFSFNFLGFDTRALLASVSFLSLAVTLGARDLVADILAGVFIIFEDDFHVGDIIEVNGFSGIVQEIGVRSTKIIGIGDNIKILGNQSVKNILNMSKMNSWYSINLKIPGDQPIEEIESMLTRELPLIGYSIPEIISGPFYKGIMEIGETNTLYIIAECRQEYYRRVQRELNHAILKLFKKHGYKFS